VFQKPRREVARATFCRAEVNPSPGFNNNAILIEVGHIKSPARFFVIISRMRNHHHRHAAVATANHISGSPGVLNIHGLGESNLRGPAIFDFPITRRRGGGCGIR